MKHKNHAQDHVMELPILLRREMLARNIQQLGHPFDSELLLYIINICQMDHLHST